jgi:hypothetical protein
MDTHFLLSRFWQALLECRAAWTLQVGERVLVSGRVSSDDRIEATRIAPGSPSGDFLVSAFVTAIGASHQRLCIDPVGT